MKRINLHGIVNILGKLLAINAGLMIICLPFAIIYPGEDVLALSLSILITASLGFSAWWLTRKGSRVRDIKKRDGFIVVSLGWIVMSLTGSLPYLISGSIPEFTNAFFETISGYTTTGASILDHVESLPRGILFWRSITQWIGGLGMVVLAIAILPILGVGGMQLFVAEAPGVTPDKIQPRIKETAKRLWLIYIGMTLAETGLLMIGGMEFFDAVNHSATNLSTGGFSTKQASIAYWDSAYIQYVVTLFMFFGGTSFVVIYQGLKGRIVNIFRQNEEFRWYIYLLTAVTIIVTSVRLITDSEIDFELAFRESVFQVVSIITTTGYATADFTTWGPIMMLIFFSLMFIGGSAGSTAGGIKIVRHLVIGKNSFTEFKRQLHPTAIIPIRFNGKSIGNDVVRNILAFVIIYITIFAAGSLAVTLMGLDLITGIGLVATSLGNVGPGLNEVGPSETFSSLSPAIKWTSCFLMLVGRLELFTVLILFTSAFWKST